MSRLSARLDTWFPRTVAMRRLSRLASVDRPVRVFVERTSIDLGTYNYILRKTPDGVAMACNIDRIRRRPWLVAPFTRRPAALIAMFSATDPAIRRCQAESSDGWESAPGVVSFCAQHAGAILVPDAEFFLRRGYDGLRRAAAARSVPWIERSGEILWRGSSTGTGDVAAADMSPGNTALIPRARLCLMLRDVPGVDARLVNAVQAPDRNAALARLKQARILGEERPPAEWLGRKFAIDIDGNCNAWSNLFTRLLLGCCVIKVASPQGYRQWYYGDLVPWRNFVPVKSDMSDLMEKIDWCRRNLAECEAIAAAGRRLAMEMTFAREIARGVETLNWMLPRD
ncbi:MAG TPA: glycosyl transferase family 90 [Bauldia sp.]|nr:glycosyl transferase family 90 [Bauldia sp.]